MATSKPPVALIAGPTASGKSSLGLALAERCGGVIVNADSAQIYGDLQILSAAPTKEDLARAEHRLYGFLGASEACSAAGWASLAKAEIAEIHRAERLPILVGGTGLYFRTLLDGIAPVPPIDPAVRSEVRSSSVTDNRRRLTDLDPAAAATLNPADSTRIARALEVALSSGRTIGEWQQSRVGGIGDSIELHPLLLLPPRDWLHARCDERFAVMIQQGAVAEVERLLKHALDPNLPAMRAIGVREIAAYLAGQMSLAEAITAGQQATRRYAKRQYTWFRHQPPAGWPRLVEPIRDMSHALALLERKA